MQRLISHPLQCDFKWDFKMSPFPNIPMFLFLVLLFILTIFQVAALHSTRWSGQTHPTHSLSRDSFVIAWRREICAVDSLCNFTHQRRRQRRQTSEEASKKASFHNSASQRKEPTAVSRSTGRRENSTVHLSFRTISTLLWKVLARNSTFWTVCSLVYYQTE